MRVRKGDIVKIIKGKDKGKTGKILRVIPRRSLVLVEGLNLVKKSVKPKKEGQKGEIVLLPRPISTSNVMLVCPHCHEATRVGYRFVNGKKHRFCKKCSQIIE